MFSNVRLRFYVRIGTLLYMGLRANVDIQEAIMIYNYTIKKMILFVWLSQNAPSYNHCASADNHPIMGNWYQQNYEKRTVLKFKDNHRFEQESIKDKVIYTGIYIISTEKSFNTIDLLYDDIAANGKNAVVAPADMFGIYKIEKDVLIICYSYHEDNRPDHFIQDNKNSLAIFKRNK